MSAAEEEVVSRKRPRSKNLFSAMQGFLNKFIGMPESRASQFSDVIKNISKDTNEPAVKRLHSDLKQWEKIGDRIRTSDEKIDVKAELESLRNNLYIIFRDSAKNAVFEQVVSDTCKKCLLI